jgi:hypothetical protein
MVILNLIWLPVLVGAMLAASPAGVVGVAWARATVGVANCGVLVVLVGRALHIHPRDLARALHPALAAAGGVVAAAGAVRLAWPADSAGALVAELGAAGAGGFAALRLLAPGTFAELKAHLLPGRRGIGVVTPREAQS